jgi:predicted nucleotidyltransferase
MSCVFHSARTRWRFADHCGLMLALPLAINETSLVKLCNQLSTAPETIRLAISHLATELPDGTRVIVFGSHAEGRAKPDSDIDLFVIEPEVKDRAAEMVRLSAALGRQLIPADVVVMSSEMFSRQRNTPNTLAWHVARQGVEYEFAH